MIFFLLDLVRLAAGVSHITDPPANCEALVAPASALIAVPVAGFSFFPFLFSFFPFVFSLLLFFFGPPFSFFAFLFGLPYHVFLFFPELFGFLRLRFGFFPFIFGLMEPVARFVRFCESGVSRGFSTRGFTAPGRYDDQDSDNKSRDELMAPSA